MQSNKFQNRTISDLNRTLSEYKQERAHYSETSHNKVIALETNIAITTSMDASSGEIKIDSYVHPSKFTERNAKIICSEINKKLGVYSRCQIMSYDTWLSQRISQLSDDIKRCNIRKI